jgi:hypothetical protein
MPESSITGRPLLMCSLTASLKKRGFGRLLASQVCQISFSDGYLCCCRSVFGSARVLWVSS